MMMVYDVSCVCMSCYHIHCADVTIKMKNPTLNPNEGDDDVIVCAVLTGPPGGLGQSVTVQFTAPANLSPNGQQTRMFGNIIHTLLLTKHIMLCMHTDDIAFPSGAALLSERCITFTDPVSDDELFETTSPLASFTVTLSDNQDRVTATGTTTINVYDDDGEIIFSIMRLNKYCWLIIA